MVRPHATAPDLALVGVADTGDLARSEIRARAKTGFLGRFEIKGLSDKSYRLHLFHSSTCFTHTTEPIPAGKSDVVIKFPKNLYRAPVTGRVVTTSGRPVANAHIGYSGCVYRYEGSSSWSGHSAGRTDADGNFNLKKIPVSEVNLSFGGLDFVSNSMSLKPEDAGQNLVITVEEVCHFRVDVSAERPLPIRFRLLDGDGKALHIRDSAPDRVSSMDSRPLAKGKSKVLSASERATTLVLLGPDAKEMGRLPVQLSPKAVTTLTK